MVNQEASALIETRRYFSGFAITGQTQEIQFQALHIGGLAVSVIVPAEHGGWQRHARLGSEGCPSDFLLHDIELLDNQLRCLTAPDWAPYFREGFIVELEDGMADAVLHTMPRVVRVSRFARQLYERMKVSVEADTHWSCLYDQKLSDIAGRIVLDDEPARSAIDQELVPLERDALVSARQLEEVGAFRRALANALQHVANDPTAPSLPESVFS